MNNTPVQSRDNNSSRKFGAWLELTDRYLIMATDDAHLSDMRHRDVRKPRVGSVVSLPSPHRTIANSISTRRLWCFPRSRRREVVRDPKQIRLPNTSPYSQTVQPWRGRTLGRALHLDPEISAARGLPSCHQCSRLARLYMLEWE